MIRAMVALFAAGVLVGACAVWARQAFGPRPIRIDWEGSDD